MQVFKTRAFAKWAAKEGLEDAALCAAIVEMAQGLIDADLGGSVCKKRVALKGRGKRGGARTLLAFKQGNRAFFIYGFAKNARANVTSKELEALKYMAAKLLAYSGSELKASCMTGALLEVKCHE